MVAASIMISGTAFADEPVMSKFKMSIGGFVKLDYVYNSTDLGSNAGMLAPASGQIPRTSTPAGNSDQSIFTARQSRLWFKVAGPELYGAKTNALIEADFYGDYASGNNLTTESPQMRMRLAYGTIDWTNTQILFGQFWDTWGPMVASTVDFRSGAGWGAPNTPRVPQVRITQKYNITDNNTISIALAAQNPTQNFVSSYGSGTATTAGVVTNGGSTAANTGVPGATFFSGAAVNGAAQLMFVSKSIGVAPGYYGMALNPLKVGVFGLYGNQSYNIYNTSAPQPANQIFSTDQSYKSWGGGVYAFVPILKSSDGKSRAGTASFEGQAYQAANMAYNTATAYGIIQTNPTIPGPAGAAQQIYGSAKGWGYAAQMMVYPTQELGVTVGTGKRQILNNESYRTINDRTTGNYQYYVNMAYDFNAAIRLSAEYQYLRTNYNTFFPVNTSRDAITGKPISTFGQSNTFRVAAFYFF
jgi:hypothetical protein